MVIEQIAITVLIAFASIVFVPIAIQVHRLKRFVIDIDKLRLLSMWHN